MEARRARSSIVDAVTLALESMHAVSPDDTKVNLYHTKERENASSYQILDSRSSGDHLKRKGHVAIRRSESLDYYADSLPDSAHPNAFHQTSSHAVSLAPARLAPIPKRLCKGAAPHGELPHTESSAASTYDHPVCIMSAPTVQKMEHAGASSAETGRAALSLNLLPRCLPSTRVIMPRNDSMVSESTVYGDLPSMECTEGAVSTDGIPTCPALPREGNPKKEPTSLGRSDDDSDDYLSCDDDDEDRVSPRSVVDGLKSRSDFSAEQKIEQFIGAYIPLIKAMLPGFHPETRDCMASNLAIANDAVAAQKLPNGVTFLPVHPSCCLLPLAAHCGIPPVSVVLGATYLQRLMATRPEMRAVAHEAGWFVVTEGTLSMRSTPGGRAALGLLSIYTACIYIASKLSDRVQYRNMLSTMLSALLRQRVPSSEAVALEAQCLERLDWRLGPEYLCSCIARR